MTLFLTIIDHDTVATCVYIISHCPCIPVVNPRNLFPAVNPHELLTPTHHLFFRNHFIWYQVIGLMSRVFTNGLGSIQGQVIPKTQKWYLIPPCLTLSIIRYGSRVKWSNPGKWVAPSPTPWCNSYQKGSLLVTLDYSRQLYFYLLSLYNWNILSQKSLINSSVKGQYAILHTSDLLPN